VFGKETEQPIDVALDPALTPLPRAAVDVRRRNGSVTVEVRDDGVGGADPAAGTGLRGLADRVSALDGRLDVDSPPGAGTTVRAVLPCES